MGKKKVEHVVFDGMRKIKKKQLDYSYKNMTLFSNNYLTIHPSS
ncbi:hypothetical protein [Butyrivibrio sp. AC2005]|nr:hypothetical protein [Butyrivibrio sp. AC2005]